MSLPVEIAVPLPANQTYFYFIKDSLKRSTEIGKRVLVPLRNRLIIGFIVGFNEPPGDIELKNVVDIIDESPLFDEKRLEFYRWIADYYITSLGLVLKFAHPGGIGTTLRRFLKLTSSGERKLKQGSINDKERNILSALDVTGEITAEKLFDLVEGTDFNSLNRLMGKGLVEYSYFLKELKPKYKRVVKARDFIYNLFHIRHQSLLNY